VPQCIGEGSDARLKPKIYNLETHEFVSNLPFSKNEFGGSNIAIPLWWEQLELFKINLKFLFFFNCFLTQKHLAKGFFFEICQN
jgi:hypothetical protein